MQNTEETFVGFWPARAEYCSIEQDSYDECKKPDAEMQKKLRATLLNISEEGWKIIVSADYMCLLHLEELEPALSEELNKECDMDSISHNFLSGTKTAWPQYIEALNAFNFLIFSSCQTGRNNVFLHDYNELSFWSCSRIIYNENSIPQRHAQYGRTSDAYLRRFGNITYDKPLGLQKIDLNIFKDATFYWSVIYKRGLVPLTSILAKIVSEHRLENYRTSTALSWFELESWINEKADEQGIETTKISKKGKTIYIGIADIINKFLLGTTVANLRDDLHIIRDKRNDIAHGNSSATIQDSSLAITCLLEVLNIKTGLKLELNLHSAPTIGLA